MKNFYENLIAELNAQMLEGNQWADSSFDNDACGSVMFDPSDFGDNYVQLFAFETEEEAAAESMDQYGIVVCKSGEVTDWNAAGVGNLSREDAIRAASQQAKKMIPFEFEGVMITDRSLSPCGRFELTEKESVELYGNK